MGLLYTIPSLGLFAVLAALFGIPLLSEANLIVALTIYAVAIMTRSVTDGLASVDPVTREAAVAVGFGPWRRFWTVDLPLAVPVIGAGLRVAAVSNVSIVSVAALIGVPQLGSLFTDGFQRDFLDPIVAGVVGCVVLALLFDLAIVLGVRLLTPWTRAGGGEREDRQAAATETEVRA